MPLRQVAGLDDPPRWLSFLLLLAGGVALSGLADFALSQAGYGALGAYVWAIGYAGTILVLFALYLRPLDLTGPDGEGGAETDR
ncbi:hypothetical protein BRC93_09110 [Halobacteriales archaeon QS_5_70_15]|jgi:hypothetical protein|nr:MAG: hypothetical protein BRC93_09110 [Halobacteriales archaeon QS_5_70_15]